MKTRMNGQFRRFKKHTTWILDLLMPRFCLGCGQEGNYLCRQCTREVVKVQTQICPKCEKLSDLGQYHTRCREGIALSGIIVAAYYPEGPIKELVHNFKYNSVLELKQFLGQILAESARANQIQVDFVTFVPLHHRRLATRGYNQAEILALQTARRLRLPVLDLLRKIHATRRQVGLIGSERRENLEKVFKVKSYQVESIRKKRILIIDDITTTGSTLNECAKILKESGAKEVWGLVVARG